MAQLCNCTCLGADGRVATGAGASPEPVEVDGGAETGMGQVSVRDAVLATRPPRTGDAPRARRARPRSRPCAGADPVRVVPPERLAEVATRTRVGSSARSVSAKGPRIVGTEDETVLDDEADGRGVFYAAERIPVDDDKVGQHARRDDAQRLFQAADRVAVAASNGVMPNLTMPRKFMCRPTALKSMGEHGPAHHPPAGAKNV